MEVKLHNYTKYWYKYIKPKKTDNSSSVYRWLFWDISLNREEYQNLLHKNGQNTFVYCSECDNELISSNSFVKDTDYVYYKCSKCGTETKWDFDFLCPILVEYKTVNDTEWKKYQGER